MTVKVGLFWENSNMLPNNTRVYKSRTSMDYGNLPFPIVNNYDNTEYIDEDVEYDVEYFYIVSVYNEVLGEKFSEQVSITPKEMISRYLYSTAWDYTAKRINLDNGNEIWSFNTGDRVNSTETDLEGNLYFGERSGRLFKVSPEGNQLWSSGGLYSPIEGISVDSSNNVYVCTRNGEIFKFDFNGNELNRHSTVYSCPNTDSIKVDAYGLYLLDDKKIIRMDLNYNVLWEKTYAYTAYETGMAVDDKLNVYIEDNGVCKYDVGGNLIWKRLSGSFTNFTIDNDQNIICTSRDQGIYKLSNNGSTIWNRPTNGNVFDCAIDSNNNIYYGDRTDQLVYKIDSNGNTVWSASRHSKDVMYSISIG